MEIFFFIFWGSRKKIQKIIPRQLLQEDISYTQTLFLRAWKNMFFNQKLKICQEVEVIGQKAGS